jgi:transcriptional regulator with XRE-family HTH domain
MSEPNKLIVMQQLGASIRNQRRLKKLTLASLAETVGLKPSYLSEVEQGRRNPSVWTLFRIARGLQCKITILVEPLDSAERTDQEE